MAPDDVAKPAYDALMKGERVIVPGGANKMMVAARRLTPPSGQAKMNEKLYAETNPAKRQRERGAVEHHVGKNGDMRLASVASAPGWGQNVTAVERASLGSRTSLGFLASGFGIHAGSKNEA